MGIAVIGVAAGSQYRNVQKTELFWKNVMKKAFKLL